MLVERSNETASHLQNQNRDFNIPSSCDDNKLCHSVISYADMSSIDDNLALETFRIEGIRVGRKLLPLERSVYVCDHTGAGQTMVDSGTQFTFLLGPVYAALRSEFVNQTKTLFKVCEDSNFVFQGGMELCYRVPRSRVRFLGMLPVMTLIFSGAEMSMSAERLVYRVENVKMTNVDGVYCFSFGNSD